jgi:septal ring factor EnvC (AmiA/AmiB activator)
MLTKSDLQAIKGLLKPLETDIGSLKSDSKDMKSRLINLKSDMKVVRSDIKLLHKKTDKFMARTNANAKELKTYKNVVRRKINLVVDTFDDRCLKLEQSPNFAILHPN